MPRRYMGLALAVPVRLATPPPVHASCHLALTDHPQPGADSLGGLSGSVAHLLPHINNREGQGTGQQMSAAAKGAASISSGSNARGCGVRWPAVGRRWAAAACPANCCSPPLLPHPSHSPFAHASWLATRFPSTNLLSLGDHLQRNKRGMAACTGRSGRSCCCSTVLPGCIDMPRNASNTSYELPKGPAGRTHTSSYVGGEAAHGGAGHLGSAARQGLHVCQVNPRVPCRQIDRAEQQTTF